MRGKRVRPREKGVGNARKKNLEVANFSEPNEKSRDRLFDWVLKDKNVKGIPTFGDYTEMLDRVKLDAVVISTPHTLHFEQIMTSLDSGLHVLSEKPMVCTVDHARQVIAKAADVEKIPMVSYQRHFGGNYRFIRSGH